MGFIYMENVMNKLIKKMIDLVFPPPIVCLGCQTETLAENDFILCEKCFMSLIEERSIRYYQFQFKNETLSLHPCAEDTMDVVCFYPYNELLQQLIWNYKFSYFKDIAKLFADSISFALSKLDIDGIVNVPSSKNSLNERGFDQMELLAAEISEITGIPALKSVLSRKTNNPHQVGLSREKRFLNVKNNFECHQDLSGKKVLLLDDVLTTGATVYYSRKALESRGAKVIIATLAHA